MTPEEFAIWDRTDAHASEFLERQTNLMYNLGHHVGWVEGYGAGWRQHGDVVDRWLGHVRQGLRTPRHAEIEARRQWSNEPYRQRCSRCSACIRAEAVARNVERYGSPDYPGAEAAAVREAA